jgi:hypothetical protein
MLLITDRLIKNVVNFMEQTEKLGSGGNSSYLPGSNLGWNTDYPD